MSEIYCGIGKFPKKSKLGTMKQCAEKRQRLPPLPRKKLFSYCHLCKNYDRIISL